MATNFPTGLDDFANYIDGTTIMEAALLNDMQFAIEALQAKVGVDGSGVSSSHDYKLTNLFGSWTDLDSIGGTLVKTEVYRVGSDGFVCAYVTNNPSSELIFLSDGSNPPTTTRMNVQSYGSDREHGFTVPVRKGDYWKITTPATPTIQWLPIGTGTCVKQ